MNRVLQADLLKLVTAADKLMPTKTALRSAHQLLKEHQFVSGSFRKQWVEVVPLWFAGITLEAHRAGYISASVSALDGEQINMVSVPFTVKATVGQPFRITVYADVLLPLVKLCSKKEAISLSIVEDKLELIQQGNTAHFNAIANDVHYDQAYAEATKPAPVVIHPIIVRAPLMLAAPKIAGLLPAHISVYQCELCHQPTQQVKLYGPLNHMVCLSCYSNVMAYESKVQARIERLTARAEKTRAESNAGWERAHQMADVIPFGQPILVGHHSERADRRYRERIWNTMRRASEKLEYAQELDRRAKAAEKNRAISSDDPTAILKLQEKLDKLKEQQAEMVRLNKLVRKVIGKVERMQSTGHHGTVAEINARFRAEQDRVRAIHKTYLDKAGELATLAGISEKTAASLLTPDLLGRVGIPDYALKNNSAEIRRLLKRVDDLEARRTTVADNAQQETHGDVTLERCGEDNRLRLSFPDKPSPQIIHCLKQNGFHWSRGNMAWQRQLNASAEWAAQRVLTFIKEQAS